MDADTGAFYFIEVIRASSGHTVTEQVTGLISSQAQIQDSSGRRGIEGNRHSRRQTGSHSTANALQCRITTRTRKKLHPRL